MKLVLHILFILFLIKPDRAFSRNDSLSLSSRNTFFLEFGGNAGGYYPIEVFTLNYDRVFYKGKYLRSSFRIGTNIPRFYAFPGGGIRCVHNIPMMLNLLFGKNRLFLEAGIGPLVHFMNGRYGTLYLGITSALALRYQSRNKGFFAKAGAMLTIALEDRGFFVGPPIGVSVGYTF